MHVSRKGVYLTQVTIPAQMPLEPATPNHDTVIIFCLFSNISGPLVNVLVILGIILDIGMCAFRHRFKGVA